MAAGAPLLVVPTLHGEDSVDGTTVSFLLAENLKLTKKEEEEEEEKEAEVEGGGESAKNNTSFSVKVSARVFYPCQVNSRLVTILTSQVFLIFL